MKFLTLPLAVILMLGASLVSCTPPQQTTLTSSNSTASGHVHSRLCGTTISHQRKIAVEMRFAAQRLPAPKAARLGPAVIDVYFHVIAANKTIAGGWVPASQIRDQMTVLNNDFAKTGVQFKLKSAIRHTSANYFNSVAYGGTKQTQMKRLYRQGGADALNIYTVGFNNKASEGLLGYSTFPADFQGLPYDDGVVIDYSTLPGGSHILFNKGRTLTHEVGHWAGLYHVFEGESCSTKGDMVADTPTQSKPTSGCPAKAPDSCPGNPGVDSMHNFMDYSDDGCMTGFTPGQISRLGAQLRTYRGIAI